MADPVRGVKPPHTFWEWQADPLNAAMNHTAAAKVWKRTKSTVWKWRKYIEENPRDESWEPPERNFPESIYELTVFDVPALLADFLDFRYRHFKTPASKPFLTEVFHQRWIEAFLHALVTGGRLAILSPPRHGKTELLIHFSTWLIIRFPLIRIIWVGGNEPLAKRSVGAVQSHLTTNQSLIAEFLPPEFDSFKPNVYSGLAWNKGEFTVATRPFPIKGASMTALGRGGTLLSLDADVIVADDIEDHKSTVQPGMREDTREWYTADLESRKEEHSCLVFIGSRHHPDDLAGHLIDNEEYVAIVETAHDLACTLPIDKPNYALHQKCMLFPAIRSFKWLMEQRNAAEDAGGRAHWEMVYLNISHPKGMVILSPEVVSKGIDPSRIIGHIPADSRLVGGLDPSGTGFQAGFLWAVTVDPFKIYMVDIDNNEGGGVKEARRLFSQWKEQYGVSQWVAEQTMWAAGLDKDHEFKDWCSQNGIALEGHLTYQNKWDSHIGVSQFVNMYLAEPVEISLPYGDTASVEKTDIYRRQLVYFSSAENKNSKKGYKSDLVMASWFPMDFIRRARSESIADMGIDYTPAYSGFGGSEWSSPPWGWDEDKDDGPMWERQDLAGILGGR